MVPSGEEQSSEDELEEESETHPIESPTSDKTDVSDTQEPLVFLKTMFIKIFVYYSNMLIYRGVYHKCMRITHNYRDYQRLLPAVLLFFVQYYKRLKVFTEI